MNPYGVNTNESNIQGPLCSLNVLYDSMPVTYGCENCEKINGTERKDYCCKLQSPSMYYIEFLNVYSEFVKWSRDKRKKLILRAIRNYLDNSINKGCIFYDTVCLCYKSRPFVCRLYGVIPEDSWQKRWDMIKARQGDQFEAIPQCTLVKSKQEVTVALEDRWLNHIFKCEKRIGIPANRTHDRAGGSYRTFHDHLLLETMGESILEFLTTIRIGNPSLTDIDLTIEEMAKLI